MTCSTSRQCLSSTCSKVRLILPFISKALGAVGVENGWQVLLERYPELVQEETINKVTFVFVLEEEHKRAGFSYNLPPRPPKQWIILTLKKLSHLHHHNGGIVLHVLLDALGTLVFNQHYLFDVLEGFLCDSIDEVASSKVSDEIHLQIDHSNVLWIIQSFC